MPSEIAKCPRCGRFFSKVLRSVCNNCAVDEDRDFQLVREVLRSQPGLCIEDVAKESGVPLETVMRMLDDGMVATTQFSTGITCGRCGAPAISQSQRLCFACLGKMDRECLDAMRDLRAKLDKNALPESKRKTSHARELVEEKREDPVASNQTTREQHLSSVLKLREKMKMGLLENEVSKTRRKP